MLPLDTLAILFVPRRRLIMEDRSMKRKLVAVGALVVVCLGALVVEGVSQPPSTSSPAPVSPPSPPGETFSVVKPKQPPETFEQLADALQAVRARQKELKAQEADLLAKMSERIEEKRKDLQKAEETLQQLQGGRKPVAEDKNRSIDIRPDFPLPTTLAP
jgi:cell pole-organizing protein PopZ